MKKFLTSLPVVIILFILNVSSIYADNLLLNSSFEDVVSGAPNNWTKNVSTATLGTSTTIKTGTSSASINKTNSTTGTIYLYQDVDVEVGSYYSVSGWAVKNDSKFSYVILRISWRDSSQELSKTDSSQLTSDSTSFQELKINSVQAPSGAIKARIELLTNISSPNPTNPILFDDISFSQVSAPEQPASTPTPIPTINPTPSPVSTPTPKPATPKPTPKPTPTPTPTSEVFFAKNTETNPPIVLGVQDNNLPILGFGEATPSASVWDKITKTSPLAFAFIAAGIVFLSLAGYGLLKQKASGTIDFTNENL